MYIGCFHIRLLCVMAIICLCAVCPPLCVDWFTFMRQKKKGQVKSLCGRWIFKSTCHSGRWPKKSEIFV